MDEVRLDGCVISMKERRTNGELRRPVGRSRRIWLESVEANMAEYVHDRHTWRRNVMKRLSKHIGTRTINR